jgi:MFS family permease
MLARFFLGAFESGLVAGAAYYITRWYKRSETNTRMAMIHIGSSFAGSISGLLAYGIVRLNGKLRLKGWQWVYIK